MKKNKNHQRPVFRLTALAMGLCAAQSSVYAMQALDEQSMRSVNGKDGLMLETSYDRIDIDRLYWQDKAGMADGTDTALRAYAEKLSITKTNPGDTLGTTYRINTGTSGGKAGLDLQIKSRYGTITTDAFRLCNGTGVDCGDAIIGDIGGIGGLTIQSREDATFHFITKDGLFSPTSLSSAEISLKHMNVYLTQRENVNDVNSLRNQLILKDFNFNFSGNGYMYVDATGGLILETKNDGLVSLNRVCENFEAADCAANGLNFTNSKPGLNIDFVSKKGILASNTNPYVTTGTQGLIRIGASGDLTNASLVFRGTNGSNSAGEAILGKAFGVTNTSNPPVAEPTSVAIMGTTGLAMQMKAKFVNAGTNPTTLELAHGGNNAYGVAFSNFTPLVVSYDGTGKENTTSGSFDSGNVYVNLADTKRMAMPLNAVLNSAKFLTGTLTDAATDYSPKVHNLTARNPYSMIVAVRDAEFQALSRQTKFIASPDVTGIDIPTNSGTWGLGLPIYNLDANLAIYGTTLPTVTPYGSSTTYSNAQRLGFALGLSTQGINYDKTKTLAQNIALGNDGSKTTSIMLIDGKKYGAATTTVNGRQVRNLDVNGDPINYYMGIRNIDMLMTAYGTIGMEEGSINLNIPEFMIAAAGEVALGYLPGSKYKTKSTTNSFLYADNYGFTTSTDVLFGLRLRLAGSVDMTLKPGIDTLTGNRMSFDGLLGLNSGAIQLVEPVDGSILGLDDISGKIGFSNQIKVNKDNVDFNTAFTINPSKTAADVLRIKNLNLYPSTSGVAGPAQRLGEMVFTGGKITSQFNITPH